MRSTTNSTLSSSWIVIVLTLLSWFIFPLCVSGRIIYDDADKIVLTGSTLLSGDASDTELVDIDGDGDRDVVLLGKREGIVLIARNDGQLFEEVPVQGEGGGVSPGFRIGAGNALAAADLDGDGDQDLVSCLEGTGNGAGAVYLYENADGDAGRFDRSVLVPSGREFEGVFERGDSFLDLVPFIECHDIAAADFDQDGDVDLVATLTDGTDAGYLVYLENDGSGSFSPTLLANNLQGVGRIDTGDFDNDGSIDLLVMSQPRNVIWIHYNDNDSGKGNRLITPTVIEASAAASHTVAVGDIDGNGELDFVAVGEGIVVYQNRGDSFKSFTFPPDTRYYLAGNTVPTYRYVQIFDVDGDGRNDILFTGGLLFSVIAEVNVRYQLEPLTFGEIETVVSSEGTFDFRMGDVTGDGIPDLVYSSSNDNKIFLLKGSEEEDTPPPSQAPVANINDPGDPGVPDDPDDPTPMATTTTEAEDTPASCASRIPQLVTSSFIALIVAARAI